VFDFKCRALAGISHTHPGIVGTLYLVESLLPPQETAVGEGLSTKGVARISREEFNLNGYAITPRDRATETPQPRYVLIIPSSAFFSVRKMFEPLTSMMWRFLKSLRMRVTVSRVVPII